MKQSHNNPQSSSQNQTHQTIIPDRQPREEEEHFIGEYEKAPQFMKDNLAITHGYRINFNTTARILKSLFMVHNESVNIWTHCLPALFLIFLLASFFLVMEGDNFANAFLQQRAQIENNLQNFHQRLQNLSFGEEFEKYEKQASQQMSFLKASVLGGYQELLDSIDQKSTKMRQIVESNLRDIRTSIKEDLITRLHQFEQSKRKFEQVIAPQVISQFQHTFNGSLVMTIRQHLEELKQHLDSPAFNTMELHEQLPNPQHVSKWPVFVFLLTAVICLLNSTLFHLFYPISSKAYGVLLRFDFAGISLLIAGTAFPTLYYGMYCQMAVATIYLAWTFGAALICFIICLFEWVHRHGHEKYRSLVFGSFGFSMAVPLLHIVINEVVFDNYGDTYSFTSSGVYYSLLISCYIIGLYVFTVRCPQRNNPGRYNICGHSHQIWHIMVVLGIVFSYFAVMENFEMRKANQCPA